MPRLTNAQRNDILNAMRQELFDKRSSALRRKLIPIARRARKRQIGRKALAAFAAVGPKWIYTCQTARLRHKHVFQHCETLIGSQLMVIRLDERLPTDVQRNVNVDPFGGQSRRRPAHRLWWCSRRRNCFGRSRMSAGQPLSRQSCKSTSERFTAWTYRCTSSMTESRLRWSTLIICSGKLTTAARSTYRYAKGVGCPSSVFPTGCPQCVSRA